MPTPAADSPGGPSRSHSLVLLVVSLSGSGCVRAEAARRDPFDLIAPPLVHVAEEALANDAAEEESIRTDAIAATASDWTPWPSIEKASAAEPGATPVALQESGSPPEHTRGRVAARTAARWVGLKSLRKVSTRVPDDCSGLVRLAYERAGIEIAAVEPVRGENLVTTLWRAAARARARRHRAPSAGDLVFFRETYDRDRDGTRDDGLTHVGIVERVERNGTVVFIHRSGSGVVRSRLNRLRPSERKDTRGKVLNDYVRRTDGTNAPRLAGELFAGYAAAGAFEIVPKIASKKVKSLSRGHPPTRPAAPTARTGR